MRSCGFQLHRNAPSCGPQMSGNARNRGLRGNASCVDASDRGSSARDANGKRAGSAAQTRGTAVPRIGGSRLYGIGTLRVKKTNQFVEWKTPSPDIPSAGDIPLVANVFWVKWFRCHCCIWTCTQCCLVKSYGGIDFGQHWLREWLVAWRH